MRAAPLLLATLALPLLTACPSGPAIQPLTRTVDPRVASLAMVRGVVDADPACVPGTQSGPPRPQSWWNALRPGQSPKALGEGVVGFHLWVNPTGTCQGFRQDLYRMQFAYELQGLSGLKGLVTKATLSINARVLPSTRPNSLCEAFTAGGGSLLRMPATTLLPASGFEELPPAQPLPSGRMVFAFPQPWLPGQISPTVNSFDGGGQRASFSVDVTALLNQALNAGDASLVFALGGSDEAQRTVRPPAEFDCRTVYSVSALSITHY